MPESKVRDRFSIPTSLQKSLERWPPKMWEYADCRESVCLCHIMEDVYYLNLREHSIGNWYASQKATSTFSSPLLHCWYLANSRGVRGRMQGLAGQPSRLRRKSTATDTDPPKCPAPHSHQNQQPLLHTRVSCIWCPRCLQLLCEALHNEGII